MFFRVPDDLKGLDIASGQCLNQSIPQNVEFRLQAETLGLKGKGMRVKGDVLVSIIVASVAAMLIVV